MTSAINRTIREAIDLGYMIRNDGTPINPNGSEVTGHEKNKNGKLYVHFTITDSFGTRRPIPVARVIAYLKFGEDAFKPGIQTRHLNGNSLDNNWSNIAIGTAEQNSMDRDPEARREHAKIAARARRRLTDDEVRRLLRLRAKGAKYKELTKLFGVSKSLISGVVSGQQYPEFDDLRRELQLVERGGEA